MMRIIWGMALMWLVACGGGGGGGGDAAIGSGGALGGGASTGSDPPGGRLPAITGPPQTERPDLRPDRLAGYEAQLGRVLGAPGQAGIAPTAGLLPDRGRAGFAGFASLRIEGPAPVVLVGDARVDIGFGTGTVTGQMDRFFGSTAGGALVDYLGVLTVTGGQIALAPVLDYAGVLSAPGQQIVASGRMDGRFLGDPVRALSGVDLEPVLAVNGQVGPGSLLVVTEATSAPP